MILSSSFNARITSCVVHTSKLRACFEGHVDTLYTRSTNWLLHAKDDDDDEAALSEIALMFSGVPHAMLFKVIPSSEANCCDGVKKYAYIKFTRIVLMSLFVRCVTSPLNVSQFPATFHIILTNRAW